MWFFDAHEATRLGEESRAASSVRAWNRSDRLESCCPVARIWNELCARSTLMETTPTTHATSTKLENSTNPTWRRLRAGRLATTGVFRF